MPYYKVLALLFILSAIKSENYIASAKPYKGSTKSKGETEVPLISATDFEYTYIKKVLNISFVPKVRDADYEINLINEGNTFFSIPKILHDVQQVAYCEFEANDVVAGENYFIEIYDEFRDRVPFKSEVLCLIAYKTPYLDCNMCYFEIGFDENIREGSISPFIKLPSNYSSCFEAYTFDLGVIVENAPGKNLCWKDDSVSRTKNATYSSKIAVTFDNLPPGNYCVNVTAHHEYCPVNGLCIMGYNADGKELIGYEEPSPPPIEEKQNENLWIAIIVPSCIVVIIIIVLIFKRRKILGVQFPSISASVLKSVNTEVSSVDRSKHIKKLVVTLLYAQSIKEELNVVLALHRFLKECCHVDSVIAEDNPELLVNKIGWIQHHYMYRHQKNGDTVYKIIILETDAAVKWYQYWLGQGRIPEPRYLHYSRLNELFIGGFNQLFSSPQSLGSNHDYIVVVRFDHVLSKIDHFQQKRLHLPHHLVELYNSLWEQNDLLNEKENLMNEWKQEPSYNDLMNTIKEINDFVERNEDYLNKQVFTDAKVMTVL